MTSAARILVFDSGLGGLSVVKALREIAPDAQLAYAADNAAFPYGDWEEEALIERMGEVVGKLIDQMQPDIVVIACNTASTIGLAALRAQFDVPFVGTVPAIKPAASLTKSGHISVLATPGTVKREYTKALIDTYAYHCEVNLHGAENLAEMAEAKLNGQGVDLAALLSEIAPAFIDCEDGRTDVVVLGCTHYPLLLEELEQAAPWSVKFVDPAPAIARQALRVWESLSGSENPWNYTGQAIVTDEIKIRGNIALALTSFGFDISANTP